jgi:hypothetical protein
MSDMMEREDILSEIWVWVPKKSESAEPRLTRSPPAARFSEAEAAQGERPCCKSRFAQASVCASIRDGKGCSRDGNRAWIASEPRERPTLQ